MSPVAAQVEIKVDYDTLGVFFWNPHPPAKAGVFVEAKGIKYPFGTKVVTVAGQNYALPPQSLFCVQKNDPNFALVIRNIECLLGLSSINDWGIRQVDMAQLESRGEEYLMEIDAAGANRICETLHETIEVQFEAENVKRVSRDLPKRDYTLEEKRGLAVLRNLSKRLGIQGKHETEGQLAAIEEGAISIPDFAVNLQKVPIEQLRTKAKLAGLLTKPGMKKHELIALLKAKKEREIRAATINPDLIAEAEGTGPREAAPLELVEEEDEDVLSDTVSLDDDERIEEIEKEE